MNITGWDCCFHQYRDICDILFCLFVLFSYDCVCSYFQLWLCLFSIVNNNLKKRERKREKRKTQSCVIMRPSQNYRGPAKTETLALCLVWWNNFHPVNLFPDFSFSDRTATRWSHPELVSHFFGQHKADTQRKRGTISYNCIHGYCRLGNRGNDSLRYDIVHRSWKTHTQL